MGLHISHLNGAEQIAVYRIEDYFNPPIPRLLINYKSYVQEPFAIRPEVIQFPMDFDSQLQINQNRAIINIRAALMDDIAKLAMGSSNEFSDRLNQALYLCRCGFSALVANLNKPDLSTSFLKMDESKLNALTFKVSIHTRRQIVKTQAVIARPTGFGCLVCCGSFKGRQVHIYIYIYI